MAQFSTGIESWDQGLGTLASGLFPDPNKIAQAGLAGAQQRKVGIETDQLLEQAKHRQALVDLAHTGPNPLGPDLSTTLTTGTPPPVSQPTAVSPAAPNTTGSDGSVPGNQPGEGVIKPGSFLPPGGAGGAFQSGPAASNGSHAPVLGLAELTALHLQAGYSPDAAARTAQSMVDDWRQRGVISEATYRRMQSSSGNAVPLTQAAETERNTARIAGENYRQNVVTGENRRQFDYAPTDTGGPNPTIQPRKDAYGKPVYNADIYKTQQNPQNIVVPGGDIRIGTTAEQMALPPEQRGRLSVGAQDVLPTAAVPAGQPTAPPTFQLPTQMIGQGVPLGAERQRDTEQKNYVFNNTGLGLLSTPQQTAAMPPGSVRIADAGSFTPKAVIDPNTGRTIGVGGAQFITGAYEQAPENLEAYTASGFAGARQAYRDEHSVPRLSNSLTFTGSGRPATLPAPAAQQPGTQPAAPETPPQQPITPGGTLPQGAIKATDAPDGTEGELKSNPGQKLIARGGYWYPADTPPLSETLTQSNVAGTGAGVATTKPPDQKELLGREFALNSEVGSYYPAPDAKVFGEHTNRAVLSEPAKAELIRRADALATTGGAKYRNNYGQATRDSLAAMVREGKLPAKVDRTTKMGMLGKGFGSDPNIIKGRTLDMKGAEELYQVPYSPTGAFAKHNAEGKPVNAEEHKRLGGK